MPAAISAAITCTSLTFAWPDGTVAIDGLDLAVGPGRSGLVGRNGSGKSTLLRLIAGELRPTGGRIAVAGEVGYLPQDLTLDVQQRVPEFLRIAEVVGAIRAIESGSVDQHHFDVIGDDWDIEQRAVAELGRLGLPPDVLDRRMGELSGGEVTQLGLTRLLLSRPDVLLLDEPTNNLDAAARERLYDVVESWSRTLLVVSHDRELLERVEQDRRPPRRQRQVVRRWLHGVRRAGDGRAGGRPAGRHHRESRPAQAATRSGRRRTRAGQSAEVREEERGVDAQDSGGHEEAAGPGIGSEVPRRPR